MSRIVSIALNQCFSLEKKAHRILTILLEVLQPLGTNGTINDTMITAQCHTELTRFTISLFRVPARPNDSIGGTNSKNGSLWRIDDGRKVRDTHHAQIGDGKCATLAQNIHRISQGNVRKVMMMLMIKENPNTRHFETLSPISNLILSWAKFAFSSFPGQCLDLLRQRAETLQISVRHKWCHQTTVGRHCHVDIHVFVPVESRGR